MKIYIQPAARIISLETEEGILANSEPKAHNKTVTGSGDGIGEQFTQDKDMWGNEDIWK